MPAPLTTTVARCLAAHAAPLSDALVGVSGGADSVALLRACHELALEDDAEAPVVVHVDHGLRPESERDANFVRDVSARLGLRCEVRVVDVPGAKRGGESIEEAARRLRYAAFADVARDTQRTVLLLAHTADDQLETVLHHLLRGSGLRGLSGMPVTRDIDERLRLLRPLLDTSRAEIEAALRAWGESFVEDETNADLQFTRNRIRHRLVPLLEAEFSPDIREPVLRAARLIGEAQEVCEYAAAEALDAALRSETPDAVRLGCERLSVLPQHLIRQVLVELWRRREWPRQAMSFAHWDRLAELTRTSSRLSLPGRLDARSKRDPDTRERVLTIGRRTVPTFAELHS